MLRSVWLCLALFFLVSVNGASASVFEFGIVSGTITVLGPRDPYAVALWFDLVTTVGQVTGDTPAFGGLARLATGYSLTSPLTIDPSLHFTTADTLLGPTFLQLTLPSPVTIRNDGYCCDEVSGDLFSPSITIDRNGPLIFQVPFRDAELRTFTVSPPPIWTVLNEYDFTGSGIATIGIEQDIHPDQSSSVFLTSATFTFTDTPEPATHITSMLALLGMASIAVCQRLRLVRR